MSWIIDSSHTRVAFSARHMMITSVHGVFEKVNGTVDFNEANPERSAVEVQIEAASINTRDTNRDTHLRSADFLNAETYPYLTFKSTRIEKLSKDHGHIHGDLTIRGVTHPVTLDVDFQGKSKSPWGTTNAGFEASAKISRKEWGLTWNVGLETGGWLVSDAVAIKLELEIIKQEVAEAAAVAA